MQEHDEIREFLQQMFRHVEKLQRAGAYCGGISVLHSQILYEVGKRDGISQIQLAEILSMDPSTLSRQVQSIVEMGLVNRVPDPRDRRFVLLHLTSAGEHKRNEVSIRMLSHVETIWNLLPEDKRVQVLESLKMFSAAARESLK